MKTKDESRALLESILLEMKHLHAKHHAHTSAFAHVLKFDSYTVFEAAETQSMCAKLIVGTQFSAPYAHHMLGKAECPWRTIRDCAAASMHTMSVPTSMW
jgi:hypothetical protein